MVIVQKNDLVVWVLREDWIYFGFMTSNCILKMRLDVCIRSFFGILGFWSIFVVVLRDIFSFSTVLMNNGPLKGKISSFLSCCINNYLNNLLSRPQARQYSFRYIIYEVLGIWYYLGWYCWLFFKCGCWCWFGPFCWWKVLPKFLLKIGSILEWDFDMSTLDVFNNLKYSLWIVTQCWVGVFVAFIQTFYNLVQR